VGGASLQELERYRKIDHRRAVERAALLWPSERQAVTVRPTRKLCCAVYTRKSSEEGLELEFNSLHAQREAGLAYVASQKSEGWIARPDHHDDAGISGGTLERPALKRLLRDVEAELIDVVVVYKVDRLSRSLMDFVKLVDIFERHNVSFVSVTQHFNTTNSYGTIDIKYLVVFRSVRKRTSWRKNSR
jgi:hypothetical protein